MERSVCSNVSPMSGNSIVLTLLTPLHSFIIRGLYSLHMVGSGKSDVCHCKFGKNEMNMLRTESPFFLLEFKYPEYNYSQIINLQTPSPIGRTLAAGYLSNIPLLCAYDILGSSLLLRLPRNTSPFEGFGPASDQAVVVLLISQLLNMLRGKCQQQ